ncbi:hypothetical protein [Dysgonomonas sp. GY617]|uniref:hypothetical protein n=1 Tax=Dysgonomonas sp. GY617 TaxID=2780420 RepID=UPI001883E724|nr:hypothetical protein [Dysgonomonas sp. GY617]MBF0575547.1 hypothetical protein [Dysgonomonas sp. GY617]
MRNIMFGYPNKEIEEVKKVDRLLRILDKERTGLKINKIRYDHKFDNDIIIKAKNLGYISFYNEDKNEYTESICDQNFCRITTEGSRTLNRYGGFENMLKYDRTGRRIAKSTLIVTIISFVFAFLSFMIGALR